ncbi:MAG: UbiH/UbiF/VisC/COQ6 family ubiquinone biosynthesis hydroxylase [Proteobacteria bacterium]|nr:UbiH/UbiF/VisC/COQ6 family ubiquinone biosynthesis hydroxylase [Pseudomonadota bacterium]
MARRKKSITSSFDALIAGGGMAGLCMAAHLGSRGLRVAVIEREDSARMASPQFDGRSTAIAHGSTFILQECGVWETLRAKACAIDDIRVADQCSLAALDFATRAAGNQPFGYIVENAFFRYTLFERVRELPSVTLKCPEAIAAIETGDEGVTVSLQNGERLDAPLLIAADGRHSFCRTQAGMRTRSWSYNQSALVATLGHSKPHHHLALENFHPGGPFALLPMTENRTSLVWTERPDVAETLKNLPEEEFCQLLRDRGGDYLGDIHLLSPRMLYPLSFMLADRLQSERLVLIGEAAHAMHPIAGQGFNLSLRDIGALGKLMAEAKERGEDVGAALLLGAYARKRHLDHFTFLAATDLLEKLFSNNIFPLRLARRFGLELVEKIPPAKQFFSRMAMGLLTGTD